MTLKTAKQLEADAMTTEQHWAQLKRRKGFAALLLSLAIMLVVTVTLVLIGTNARADNGGSGSRNNIEPLDSDEEDFVRGFSGAKGTEDSEQIQGVRLQNPRFAGRGCPPGTVTSQLSADAKSLTILFDNYIVDSSGAPGRRSVSSCDISVPMQVPAGYRMTVGRIDYRGFALAPNQGRAVLKTITQIVDDRERAVSRPVKRRRVFQGPVGENFQASSSLRGRREEWSRCGESFNLKIRTDLIAVTNRQGEQTMMSLDSIDSSARADYYISWKKCGDTGSNTNINKWIPKPTIPTRPTAPSQRNPWWR